MNLRLATLFLVCALPVMVAGQEVVCTPFDNNGDNIVGIGDLIDLLARFGDSDLDQDGIWDSADDCVGAYDTCGVCNGPGPQVLAIDTIIITFDSIYVDALDEWLTYELSRDTLLHLVCENPGCTDPIADNYDPYAEDGGFCFYENFCYTPTLDGHTYAVVEIGSQCWFSENLRTSVFANGDSIQSGLTDSEWMSTISGASAIYGQGNSNCNNYYSPNIDACDEAQSLVEYGRLYNWYAVDDARGLCPSGWHVPSEGEWDDLEDFLISQEYQPSPALRSVAGWYWNNGYDDFGFSARPGGQRIYNSGAFYGAGQGAYWWASSFYVIVNQAGTRHITANANSLLGSSTFPRYGLSVRCLRDS